MIYIHRHLPYRPRILDLFCGAGGAAEGYRRAGFIPTGIDIVKQKNYPYQFVRADALEYLDRYGHEFDVIHASPPCQAFSKLTPVERKKDHPDLIAPVRELLKRIGKPYVIENVENARHLLINPLMICGSMLGLKLWRHRYFEVNPPLWWSPGFCDHSFTPVLISGTSKRKKDGVIVKYDYLVKEKQDASEIHWMTGSELDDAIPPAYTEYIGKQLMTFVMAAQEGKAA